MKSRCCMVAVMQALVLIFLLLAIAHDEAAFVHPSARRRPATLSPNRPVAARANASPVNAADASPRKGWISHWMDYLRFGDSTPSFDVLARTQEYASLKSPEEIASYYADDYIFRGSIIGPITNQDVIDTQDGFDVAGAYPDLDRGIFGFTIDPNNPYRCFYFERWTGTNKGAVNLGPWIKIPATNARVETPIHISSIVWNPEGKIVYQSISPPVDRFEGNTKGGGAIFGLLVGAGLEAGPPSVGLPSLIMQQKLVQAIGLLGKQWSDDDRIPAWWKSSARGADPNDV